MSIAVVEIPFGRFIHATIIYWVVGIGMIVTGMSVSNRGRDASVGKSYSGKFNSKVYGFLECDSPIENTERDESVSLERVFYWKRGGGWASPRRC